MMRTLWRLALLALGALCILAAIAAASWFGWLGGVPEATVKRAADYLSDLYFFYREEVQRAFAIAAAIVSAVLGTLTFVRAWHHADASLPQRLEDFISASRTRNLEPRERILSLAAVPNLADPGMWQLRERMRARAARAYLASLKQWNDSLGKRLKLIEMARSNCAVDLATTHLAAGIEHFRHAQSTDPKVHDVHWRAARFDFREAARLDPGAAKYLWKAVDLSEAHDEADEADKDLDRLLNSELGAIDRAEALRRKARIAMKRSTGPKSLELAKARVLATEAQDRLQNVTDLAGRRGRAAAFEMLGDIQVAREKFVAGRSALQQAIDIYREFDQTAARNVEQKLSAITGEQDQ